MLFSCICFGCKWPWHVMLFTLLNGSICMLCWPCIVVYQYSETNVMHFLLLCWPCIIAYQYSETNVMHFLLLCWLCIVVYQYSETNVMHFLLLCWPCIIAYQYSETNMMHFLFSLLRIKGNYMFRVLLVHPQEALHKLHLVYCVHVVSVGCTRIEAEASILVQPTDIRRTQYRKCHCVVPPEDEQVMLKTCSGP
jgi:hypothetical protein